MKYRTLGKTGMDVSVIGIGTWQFGGEWGVDYTAAEAAAILAKGKELGINLIDTAECYGDHLSEQLIGQYLKQDRREDWIVATKFGHFFHDLYDRTDDFSAEAMIKQLDDSLKALQTDYVDLYQFHSGSDDAFDNEALWTALSKQKEAGKIKHIGISLNKQNSMHQVNAAEQVGAEVIQIVYNRLDRGPEDEVFPTCMAQNLGVLARVPLASGLLSGKYKPGTTFAANDVRSHRDQALVQSQIEQAQSIQQSEVPEGINMAQWALAWCLKHDAVTTVIPGCKTPEQVAANVEALQYIGDEHPQQTKPNSDTDSASHS
ncbi:aldo/keto reductase [Marinicrinis sediminis]|uniref:Aldo/keto reductase n=1 Tax=Marinicrinis sediminis TaxID=1652465 RepID=A0ABW5R8P8_9BACL